MVESVVLYFACKTLFMTSKLLPPFGIMAVSTQMSLKMVGFAVPPVPATFSERNLQKIALPYGCRFVAESSVTLFDENQFVKYPI